MSLRQERIRLLQDARRPPVRLRRHPPQPEPAPRLDPPPPRLGLPGVHVAGALQNVDEADGVGGVRQGSAAPGSRRTCPCGKDTMPSTQFNMLARRRRFRSETHRVAVTEKVWTPAGRAGTFRTSPHRSLLSTETVLFVALRRAAVPSITRAWGEGSCVAGESRRGGRRKLLT